MSTQTALDLTKYKNVLRDLRPIRCQGRVEQVIGLTVEAAGLNAQMAELCHIHPNSGRPSVAAEVVGFRHDRTLLMPLADMQGVQPGTQVTATGGEFTVPVGNGLLGRILDGLGRPIDGKGPLVFEARRTAVSAAPHPLQRTPIQEPLVTGIRAIDGLLTTGKGQRMGIFAGSGVGKSTLMGMIARRACSDVNVIALIGERGREVQEFVQHDLGQEGLERSVVIVSTSDQPALARLKGAWVATTIAEFFRDQGLDVTFLMDSVTRFAMAQREVGLAVGEPPASKGYTPSVFSILPKLLERTGTSDKGTITGFYTVLVEGDDLTEPVTDAVRSILDGHIVLTRELAAENHYPAIDVLGSVSRVMPAITEDAHRAAAARMREVLATHRKARDIINIGAYAAGSSAQIDHAIAVMPKVLPFLRQPPDSYTPFEETVHQMEDSVQNDADRA
ncbi:MAG: FliI/YscN family ATPase [Chloroflexi bacterium]|nr:FliI/YscN family ATPase [Chloroflexota bacterium]